MSRAAVFSDVEGTLIDASLPRISLRVGRQLGIFSPLKMAEFGAINLVSRLLPAGQQRRARYFIIQRAMQGRTEAEITRLSDELIPDVMKHMKAASWTRVQSHIREGLPLVLMSAGLHQAIARLGQELGGRGEGTKFMLRNGRYTAAFDGSPCEGEAKKTRALAVAREMGLDPALCYAYGDTAGDIPFLAAFGHPCAVDPDEGLEREAKSRGWEIFRTVEPTIEGTQRMVL